MQKRLPNQCENGLRRNDTPCDDLAIYKVGRWRLCSKCCEQAPLNIMTKTELYPTAEEWGRAAAEFAVAKVTSDWRTLQEPA